MIQMRKISKVFQRPGEPRLEILREVDLDVETGEMVAVVGPSGSGKTTLLNLLGLLARPDSGEYRLAGESVSGLGSDALARLRNRRLGFVFQQFHLLPRTTAIENVELPLQYSPLQDSLLQDGSVDDPRDRAAQALCQVGLEDRLHHMPSELSGGQQQRVAIARALVTRPDLILADEPTGNLDRESGEGILDLFERLHESGCTIVFITHDPQLAQRASRVIRIAEGGLHAMPPVGASPSGASPSGVYPSGSEVTPLSAEGSR